MNRLRADAWAVILGIAFVFLGSSPLYPQSASPAKASSRLPLPSSAESVADKPLDYFFPNPFSEMFTAIPGTPEERRKILLARSNDELRKFAGLHDTYLTIADIGNEESVPLLLERLRLDFGASEPNLSPGIVFGGDCAQAHLVDALKTITNADQGFYYPRWAEWWKKHQNLTQRQWFLDGFASAGLDTADPINKKFGMELIGVLGQENRIRSFNAERLLGSVSPAMLSDWIAEAAGSTEGSMRLGAITEISKMETNGQEKLLRTLAADGQIKVRRQALSVLNEHLRAKITASPATEALHAIERSNGITSVIYAGDLIVVACRDGDVQGVDQRTLRPMWTVNVGGGIDDKSLFLKGRYILSSHEGFVAALDRTGKIVWQRKPKSDNDQLEGLFAFGKDLFVFSRQSVELLDVDNGKVKAMTRGTNIFSSAVSPAAAYFLDSGKLRSFNDPSELNAPILGGLGLAVAGNALCASNGYPKNVISCLALNTLSPLWTMQYADWQKSEGLPEIIADGARAIVITDEFVASVNASDGSIVWSSSDGFSARRGLGVTEFGLLVHNAHGQLELRDPEFGEVLRLWPQIVPSGSMAAYGRLAAVRDLRDILWFVDLAGTAAAP